MSGYLSNLLTNTTSRYTALRRNLLSDEADGDTEDDTHVCRVLRAYYGEKGRGLPQWLPPDPKKAIAPSPSTSSYQSIWQTSSSQQPTQTYNTAQSNSSRGALSDLWDPPAPSRAPAANQPTSLRRQPGHRTQQSETLAPPVQARPMPSQRAGSYQTQRPAADPSPPPSSGSGGSGTGTAQERLKARLYGGRAGSPSFGSSSGGGTSQGGGGRWG